MSGNPYSPPTAQVQDIGSDQPSLERPPLVTIGVRLLWMAIALALVQLVLGAFNQFQNVDDAMSTEYLFALAYSLGVTGVMAILTWHAGKGRNWARILHLCALMLGVLAAVGTYLAMRSVMSNMGSEMPANYLGVGVILLTALKAAAVLMLFTPSANAWYRAIKSSRTR